VLIYVFFGGMRGTAWANTFQTMVFMILGIITFYTISSKLGGLEAASEAVLQHHPEKLARTELSKLKFFTYLFIPLSVGMFPHLFQHWLTAKSDKTFKLPVVAHPLFIMIVWVPCVLIGVWATSIMGEDGVTPMLSAKVPANAVLAVLVKKMTTPLLAGLLTAGILAAIMSSLDSQFLCVGTIFTEDIVLHYRGRDRLSDKQEIMITRGFIIGVVIVTYILAMFADGRRIFPLAVWCFSGFSSLFPLIFASLYWKRLTKLGAYACVLAAFGSWFYLFSQSGYASNPHYVLTFHLGEAEYEMMPVVGMISCSTIAMVVVSLLTKAPSQETLNKFFPKSTD